MFKSEGGTQAMLSTLAAISSTLDLRQMLFRLVEVTASVCDADYAGIFLVQGDHLVPTAAAARRTNSDHLRRFRRLEPIPITDVPGGRSWPDGDEIVVIDDVLASPVIPEEWTEAFGLRSLAVARLSAGNDWLGVLAVVHLTPHSFDEDEIALIEGIGRAARIALGNASLHERLSKTVEAQNRLLNGLAVIGTSTEVRDVLASIATCVASLFEGRSCSISFLRRPADTISSGPIEDDGDRVAFPLRTDRALHGYLTVSGGSRLDAEEMALIEAFAHQAALAVDRAQMHVELRDRLRRTQALYRLSDLLTGTSDFKRVLGKLNQEVCSEMGMEVLEVAFRRRRLAEILGCRTLTDDEQHLLSAVAIEGVARHPADENVFVAGIPVRHHVSGLVFIATRNNRDALSDEDAGFIQTLAQGFGEVAYRARLAETAKRAETHVQIGESRRRLAQHIDQTIARTLTTLWEALSEAVAKYGPDAEVSRDLAAMRSLVSRGLVEAHTTAESLALLRLRRDGLIAALRGLARSFQQVSSISTTFRIDGIPRPLPQGVEEAIYAICFEALSTVERKARASAVVVHLSYGPQLTLSVRDDGIGLSQRSEGPWPGVHFGIQAIRERASTLGGTLQVEAATPRGVRLRAVIPVPSPGEERRPNADAPGRVRLLRPDARAAAGH